jgi:DNA-binding response OmpR family regulator
VPLTGAEARLLALLFEARGEVLGREQFCQRLSHGKNLDDTRRLDSLISRLRSKVEQQSGVALPLQTFRNLGYAFSGAGAGGGWPAASSQEETKKPAEAG